MRNKGELIWWGIFLIFMGAGAFILPLFGKSFTIFTIFGDYAPVAAIVCLSAGGILVILGMVLKVLEAKRSGTATTSPANTEDKANKE